jgi:hypothetical protein
VPNSPLTNTRIPDSTYTTNPPQDIHNAVYDLEVNGCPRFTTTTARDAAYSAWVAAGNTLANGRSCWTDDSGFWDRIGGAWLLRLAQPTSGILSLTSGWAAYPGYHVPLWDLDSTGRVSLRGAVKRTGADFVLAAGGSGFQFATLPAGLAPATSVSPLTWVGLANGGSFPAKLYIAPGSTSLNIMGMDSGSGTMTQNQGSINLDGVRYQL